MHRYIFLPLILLVVVIASFAACSQENNLAGGTVVDESTTIKETSIVEFATSPEDKSIIDLATHIYGGAELLDISKYDGPIDNVNNRYPIECLRYNNGVYRASYLGSGKVTVVLFDNSGNRIGGYVYQLVPDFEQLLQSKTLEEVMEIDPHGQFLFLYTGMNDLPRSSSHYTTDGRLIVLEYDDTNKVINITEEYI